MGTVLRYYLEHDTPAGTRYAYPLDLTELGKRLNRPMEAAGAVSVSDPANAEVEIVGDWAVATAPIRQVRIAHGAGE